MDYRVALALKWIHENFGAGLTPREISTKSGLSISQFYNLFRNETGITPAAYIRKLRYERASELLINSNLSVKEITGAVGICDVSHFVRTFHEIHGLPPIAFRHKRRLSSSMMEIKHQHPRTLSTRDANMKKNRMPGADAAKRKPLVS